MGDKNLKREDQKLRNKIHTLSAKLQSLKCGFEKIQDGCRGRSSTNDLAQLESSVQCTSDKYDDLLKFVMLSVDSICSSQEYQQFRREVTKLLLSLTKCTAINTT